MNNPTQYTPQETTMEEKGEWLHLHGQINYIKTGNDCFKKFLPKPLSQSHKLMQWRMPMRITKSTYGCIRITKFIYGHIRITKSTYGYISIGFTLMLNLLIWLHMCLSESFRKWSTNLIWSISNRSTWWSLFAKKEGHVGLSRRTVIWLLTQSNKFKLSLLGPQERPNEFYLRCLVLNECLF